jgi:hypothetical protein
VWSRQCCRRDEECRCRREGKWRYGMFHPSCWCIP